MPDFVDWLIDTSTRRPLQIRLTIPFENSADFSGVLCSTTSSEETNSTIWFNESEAYNELTTAALLPFRIRLVNGTRTRPVRQDEAHCKCENTSAFRSFADDCNLNRVYNCVFTRANSHLATLLNASWPLDLNSIDNVLTFDQCKDVGFSDADLGY